MYASDCLQDANVMRKIFILMLVFSSVTTHADVLNAGDVFSFSFDPGSLYVVGNADPAALPTSSGSLSFEQVLVPGTTDLNTGISTPSEIVDFTIEVRVFEDVSPVAGALETYSFSSTPGTFSDFFGFILPVGTWGDLDGLVEVEVLQGQLANLGANVSITANGLIYSSIAPVPLPASLWLVYNWVSGLCFCP